jgi:hypothetical protein
VEEKERRRAEILDAAEALYAKGWDLVTVDQIAREEILFAIGERAMCLLRDRFMAAAAGQELGVNKVEAIGRAYMAYAFEFPHYFDFCSKFNAHSGDPEPGSHDLACRVAGDEAFLPLLARTRADRYHMPTT